MATPYPIPQPQRYNDPVKIYPSNWRKVPPEGDLVVPAQIDWGNAGANRSVSFNLTDLSTLPFSQIAALWVDNVLNDFDVVFVFADTNFVLRVPAASSGLYPVTTNGRDFVVISTGSIAGAMTRFSVYNSYPFPVAVAKTDFVQTAGVTVSGAGSSTTQVIAATLNGVLGGVTITLAGATAAGAAGSLAITLVDGTGAVLLTTGITLAAGQVVDQRNLVSLTGLAIPFRGGISLVVVATGSNFAVGGSLITNLFTR
jgi:hypothetical protein